jgi:hypothetical protein
MVRRLLLGGLTAAALGGCFGSMLDAPADPVDAEPPDAQWPDAGAPDATPIPVCVPPATSLETGHHFPGESCTGLCHDGANGPRWTFAGTLYDNEFGSHVVPDATIHLIDADGRSLTLVTAQNGNFWTNAQLTYPIRTYASACPNLEAMVARVTSSSCNAAACHDATRRIYLPPP